MVKIFLAGEVAEKDGFAHAGGSGDVLGLGAAEAVPGKAFDRYPQQLPPAILTGHSGGAGGSLGGLGWDDGGGVWLP